MDVRYLDALHVGALNSPPEDKVGRKRTLALSPHKLDYEAAAELIGEKWPELKIV